MPPTIKPPMPPKKEESIKWSSDTHPVRARWHRVGSIPVDERAEKEGVKIALKRYDSRNTRLETLKRIMFMLNEKDVPDDAFLLHFENALQLYLETAVRVMESSSLNGVDGEQIALALEGDKMVRYTRKNVADAREKVHVNVYSAWARRFPEIAKHAADI